LNRSTHPILFAKAQKTGLVDQALKDADLKEYGGKWGDGDGSTTFTCPIYDGAFLRYADNGRGLDVGRELGSWQDDAIRNIEGSFGNIAYQTGQAGGTGRGAFEGETGEFGNTYLATSSSSIDNDGIDFDASRVVPTAADNRPMNYAVDAEFLV
jgi:phage-related tail fiber protein